MPHHHAPVHRITAGQAASRSAPGQLLFIVADTTKARGLGWLYQYRKRNGTTLVEEGIEQSDGHPRYEATKYYSTPWQMRAIGHDRRRALVQYQRRRGYCLDHIGALNVPHHPDRSAISVVLSTAAHRSCKLWRSESPYIDVDAYGRRFDHIIHAPTGPATYNPIFAGGTPAPTDPTDGQTKIFTRRTMSSPRIAPLTHNPRIAGHLTVRYSTSDRADR